MLGLRHIQQVFSNITMVSIIRVTPFLGRLSISSLQGNAYCKFGNFCETALKDIFVTSKINDKGMIYSGFALPIAIVAKCEEIINLAQKI